MGRRDRRVAEWYPGGVSCKSVFKMGVILGEHSFGRRGSDYLGK